MTSVDDYATTAAHGLLHDISLEITGRDAEQVSEARGLIPPGTRIHVTYLAKEDLEQRLAATRAVLESGFTPVPHISARRLASQSDLQQLLGSLRQEESVARVFLVAGDPESPAGPYDDSMSIIDSGLLQLHGTRHVGISGYPEGHPLIPSPVLWEALAAKAHALSRAGLDASIITQFGFDVDAVLKWISEVRDRGIHLPVRIGVPGPVGVKRLLSYSRRFGVGTSAGIARKYGFSLTNLMSTAGPDQFVDSLSLHYAPELHGPVGLHFYTFGGLPATVHWLNSYRRNR